MVQVLVAKHTLKESVDSVQAYLLQLPSLLEDHNTLLECKQSVVLAQGDVVSRVELQ